MKKILVIDDENPIADLIAEFCEVIGFKAMTLNKGKDALGVAKKYHPDLITLDLSIPDLSGNKVLALLKNDQETRKIPVVVISSLIGTGLGESQDENINLSQGILPKPIKISVLKEKINKALSPSRV